MAIPKEMSLSSSGVSLSTINPFSRGGAAASNPIISFSSSGRGEDAWW